MELLASPWVRCGAPDQDVTPDLWDTWSRKARVLSGASSWRDDLAAWHEADVRDRELRAGVVADAQAPWIGQRLARIQTLTDVIERLEGERVAWSRCKTHGE